MDIRQACLTEHSRAQTISIAAFIGNDPERFRILMDIFLHEKYRLVQRSAWALSYVIEKHPSLIQPYLAQTIDLLGKAGQHPSKRLHSPAGPVRS
jgi:hypothetical protein